MGSLLSSMAVFVPCDRKLQRAYSYACHLTAAKLRLTPETRDKNTHTTLKMFAKAVIYK